MLLNRLLLRACRGHYIKLADKQILEQITVWLNSREGTDNTGGGGRAGDGGREGARGVAGRR